MAKIPNREDNGNLTSRAVAAAATDAHVAPPDWDRWGSFAEAWLPEAVALSCDIAPEALGMHVMGIDPLGEFFNPSGLAFRRDLPPEFGRRFEIAVNCMRAGDLSSYQRGSRGGFVRLIKFGKWAEETGWSLPARFPRPRPAPNLGTRGAVGAIGTKERTTLLTIIAGLAEKLKIDTKNPTTAAKAIVAAIDGELGVRVGVRTVEEWLKQIPDALDRKEY